MWLRIRVAAVAFCACTMLSLTTNAFAEGDLHKVHHIKIVMQENHSFDNYFGVLPYAPVTPYHPASGACAKYHHKCVDGLSCTADASGNLTCSNANFDDNGSTVVAFHATSRCVKPDLDHSWIDTHREVNFDNPNATLLRA